MVYRFNLLLAVMAMAVLLASCGGNANNAMLSELPAADGPVVADQTPGLGDELPGADKSTAQYIPGYYTVTAGATYIDGVDYQFYLMGDNKGSYIWQLVLTNNHWQPKTIHYAHNQRRYTFRIDQDGVNLWNSNSMVPKQPAGTLVLQPYAPHIYTMPWNGADKFGNSIYGIVTATAIHRDASNIVSMSGMAWLNGVIGKAFTSEWPMFGMGPQHTRFSAYNGPQTHAVKWTYNMYPSSDYTVGGSPAIGADGAIYVGSGNWMYAFNPDGSLRWEAGPYPGWFISSPAVGADGTIYIGFEGGGLMAFKPTGQVKWNAPTGGHVLASPVIGDDGVIYIASLEGFVTAVKPNGTVKWLYSGAPPIYSSPALGEDGTVYVGIANELVAINPNGIHKWAYATSGQIHSSPSVGADGTVFIGSDDHHVYAVNPDGTMKWTFDAHGPVRSSPAIDASGTIYIGCEGPGYVYAINQWGFANWTYHIGSPVSSSPSIGADGTVYFGADDDNVYAFYSWGFPKWTYPTGGDVDSSPAISKDGCLYIVSDDNKLYSFGM